MSRWLSIVPKITKASALKITIEVKHVINDKILQSNISLKPYLTNI